MAKSDIGADIKKMSFEQALEELEAIVRRLESETVDLDNAISAYERGTQLRNHCGEKLRQAEEKVSQIKVEDQGEVAEQPGDAADEPPF